jgi:hypothetical protein
MAWYILRLYMQKAYRNGRDSLQVWRIGVNIQQDSYYPEPNKLDCQLSGFM